MTTAILSSVRRSPTTTLVPCFQQLPAISKPNRKKKQPALHYILRHKRESIYPLGSNLMVTHGLRRNHSWVHPWKAHLADLAIGTIFATLREAL